MSDTYPPSAQRSALDRFAVALNCSPSTLRRDDCGDPSIRGKRGHVYATPGESGRLCFWIYHAAGSGRGWTNAKRDMAFASLVNDGDDEGAWSLDRLPTAAEAETIRSRLSIRKRVAYSDEVRAAMTARLRMAA
jgi:hypothetical protein